MGDVENSDLHVQTVGSGDVFRGQHRLEAKSIFGLKASGSFRVEGLIVHLAQLDGRNADCRQVAKEIFQLELGEREGAHAVLIHSMRSSRSRGQLRSGPSFGKPLPNVLQIEIGSENRVYVKRGWPNASGRRDKHTASPDLCHQFPSKEATARLVYSAS